ncbi:MAG TPA: hypothetical protein VF695_12200 [Sphingomonas sp.]|jgi:hypothetical protein
MSPRSSEVDAIVARAKETSDRVMADYRGQVRGHTKRLRRKATSVGTRIALIAAADAIILIAAMVIGFVVPIGLFGFLAVMLLMLAVTLGIAMAPVAKPPTEAKLREVDLRALPAQTERWLEAQRPQLPAPAARLIDRITQRLEMLSPQLAQVEPGTEAEFEVRKLVGEQLPAFVKDYAKVPPTLRGVERNGRTPDGELVGGLQLIEREIADMTARLAQGDLDQLQTRGRYLEMKYKDEHSAD